MERQREIQNPNNESRFSLVLSVPMGKCLRQCFSHSYTSERCLCSMLPVQSGKGNGQQGGESACSQVCSAWLSHFRDSGVTWGEVQNSCKSPKVTWGKTKQNLSSTCSKSSVMFLYRNKRKIKMRTTSTHLAELSAVHGGRAVVSVESWDTEVITWLGCEAPTMNKTQQTLFNKPPSLSFPLCEPGNEA